MLKRELSEGLPRYCCAVRGRDEGVQQRREGSRTRAQSGVGMRVINFGT